MCIGPGTLFQGTADREWRAVGVVLRLLDERSMEAQTTPLGK